MSAPAPASTALAPENPVARAAASGVISPRVVGLITLCVLAAASFFWAFLRYSTRAAIEDPNWSHILVVPAISGYYIYLHRSRILALPASISWLGLVVAFLGLLSYVWWIYPGRNDMFRGFSMILCLFGSVWFFQGGRRMSILWFPIAYLTLAVKIPDSIWQKIAFQLQQIASAGSEITLTIAGALLNFRLEAVSQDFVMTWFADGGYQEARFSIAEACSGLRMLMAFVALGVALAFLWDRFWWQRLIMVSMAIPIALLVNIGRVTTLGLLNLWDPELARGDAHIMVGMLMLIPAGLMFLGLGWVLDQILVIDQSEKPQGAASAAPASAAGAVFPEEGITTRRLLGFVAGGLVLSACGGLAYMAALDSIAAVDLVPWLPPAAAVGTILALAAIAAAAIVLLRRARVRPLGGLAVLAGVFLGSSIALTSVVEATQTVLIKEDVPLRHELVKLPKTIGPWSFVRDEKPLDKDRQDELGTADYITRTYRDTRLDEDDSSAYASVHIAYYTGMIDTVPHVPDRCWVAGGMLPGPSTLVTMNLNPPSSEADAAGVRLPTQLKRPGETEGFARLPSLEVPATRFTAFVPQRPDEPVTATYFFVANGNYFATPNRVRLQGVNLRDRYSYYCKVEVMFPALRDAEQAALRTADLLSHLLPEIMATLPDWTDVRAGTWPQPDSLPGQSQPALSKAAYEGSTASTP